MVQVFNNSSTLALASSSTLSNSILSPSISKICEATGSMPVIVLIYIIVRIKSDVVKMVCALPRPYQTKPDHAHNHQNNGLHTHQQPAHRLEHTPYVLF
nr:hypothetical protein BSM_07840 [uncultured archaeon]